MGRRPTAPVIRALSLATAALAAAVAAFAFTLAALDAGTERGGGGLQSGERPLDADQAEVRGTLTRVVGMQVAGPVLVLPLTLEVERGGGTKATFAGGTVGGVAKTVLWDGGRPLPLSGEGSLDLAGPADVEVTSAGARWTLDGGARTLTRGTYRFGATVAVGSSGLGAPQDGVTLAVVDRAAVTTKGRVTTLRPPAPVELLGPGTLVLEGDLRVRTPTGTTPAGSARFGPGAFTLSMAPREGGGLDVTTSLLQGTVTVGG